jgi:prepilin-type N-terminal cleavage/methylation domain-containing protein
MERRSGEEGFSLIELMVVLSIIGILLAITMPSLLASRNRAQDKDAEFSLRVTLSNGRIGESDGNTFLGVNATKLGSMEPSLAFVDDPAPSSGPRTVSVLAVSKTEFRAAAQSNSGTCFLVKDVTTVGGGTTYASFTPGGGTTCTANASATYGQSW